MILLDPRNHNRPYSDERSRDVMRKTIEFFEIEPGSVLVDEGQKPIGMYVLLTGEALIESRDGNEIQRLAPGNVFGEEALLQNQPSAYKVVAVSNDSVTVEATGTPEKLEALLRVLDPYGIREIVQSGVVSLSRGPRGIGTSK